MATKEVEQVAEDVKVCMQSKGYTPFTGSTDWASDTVEALYQSVTSPDRVYIVSITRTDQDWLKMMRAKR